MGTRIEVDDTADGRRTLSIECEDMVPGIEIEPWIAAFERLVQVSGRLLVAGGIKPTEDSHDVGGTYQLLEHLTIRHHCQPSDVAVGGHELERLHLRLHNAELSYPTS